MISSGLKSILVTGGTRGIGKAICIELAKRGHTVVFTYQNNDAMAEQVISSMRELSDLDHRAVKCNMSDFREVQSVFRELKKSYPKIDVLVNNAGITGAPKLFLMTSEVDWWAVFDNNMKGVINTTRCILPGMISRKDGIIVNIASISAREGTPGSTAYSASKAAIIGFTKSLFREVAQAGIRVFSVSPGMVGTEMINNMPEEYMKYRVYKSPLLRVGKPEEVANLVAYLAEDPPIYLGGQDITIDGLQ